MTRRLSGASLPGMPAAAPPDAGALLRSPSYTKLLVLAALVGLPISAIAYGFLVVVDQAQKGLFDKLPDKLGFATTPMWWPLPVLVLGGVATAAAIRFLPGTGGHSPADGFKPAGALPPIQLPGVIAAAFATLCTGVVLGPEAPLIAIGSGLGVLAVRLPPRGPPGKAPAGAAPARPLPGDSSPPGGPPPR